MEKYIKRITHICDQFVDWQAEDGGIEISKCPYLQPEYKPLIRYMEVPFMARTLYGAYDLTKKESYKNAADHYCKWYINLIDDLIPTERIAYKFGIAIESACLYAKYNPMEYRDYMVHANLILKWLRQLRTDVGCYFRCGYLPGIESLKHVPDVGFSDDLCHVGRGITKLYECTKDQTILNDMEGLAHYFMTDVKENTMEGIWLKDAGTWAIGPWPDTAFEHMDNTPANSVGWVWSAFGDVDFLTFAARYFSDPKLVSLIRDKAVSSNRWIFRNCQFDDGAIGMTGRDDKWVGLTAAAIMAVVGMYQKELLTEEEIAAFKPAVGASWTWLLNHTGENLPVAGYIRQTGHTSPVPGDNVAWLFAWTAECLMMGRSIEQFLR